MIDRALTVSDPRQYSGYVVRRERAQPRGANLELLNDLGGRRNRRLWSGDMDAVVAGRDTDAQSVADASQVLVTGAEKGQ